MSTWVFVAKSRRRTCAKARRAAIDAVSADLSDEDADVYNLVDAAVREDALALALNLTGLAATAITALAAATGRTPEEVLRSMA